MFSDEVPDGEPGPGCRLFATALVEAAHRGSDTELADAVTSVARAGSPRLPAAVVAELTGMCAEIITSRWPVAEEAIYTAEIEDERAGTVAVDRLPPGVRGALRAVLAALNGDHFDSVVQAELATSGEPGEIAEVILHCLAWLLELDEAQGAPPPPLSCFGD
jgi:hypothetical protein